jgi:hypothetical protein
MLSLVIEASMYCKRNMFTTLVADVTNAVLFVVL